MPRWEHGSVDRLKQAAVELFDEQGFENTSVVQIAERARVTTRTFFRYFPDKQEVLFADADALRAALVTRVEQAADAEEPLRVVMGALVGFDWASVGSRDGQRKRHALIAANPELLERDLVKQHGWETGFADALRRRGVAQDTAALAAATAVQAFRVTYQQWLEAGDDDADLATISQAVVSLLEAVVCTHTPG